jgi:RNAse (barnase) inhibitor barstar
MMRVLGPEVSLADVVARARDAGEDVYVVRAMATKAESIAEFAVALRLPEWFGHNLDALADALHDFAAQAAPGAPVRHLVWTGVERLRTEHGRAYEGICAVLDEVAEDHPRLHVTVLGGAAQGSAGVGH